jgi:hypothetical protein
VVGDVAVEAVVEDFGLGGDALVQAPAASPVQSARPHSASGTVLRMAIAHANPGGGPTPTG